MDFLVSDVPQTENNLKKKKQLKENTIKKVFTVMNRQSEYSPRVSDVPQNEKICLFTTTRSDSIISDTTVPYFFIIFR